MHRLELLIIEELHDSAPINSSAPPPPISSCDVSQHFDTAITIQWRAPANCGGRSDCYYQLKINSSSPEDYSPVFRPNAQEMFTVDDLESDMTYSITVGVHNGVSDQDSENARNRECMIVAKTVQGSKYDQSKQSNFHSCLLMPYFIIMIFVQVCLCLEGSSPLTTQQFSLRILTLKVH